VRRYASAVSAVVVSSVCPSVRLAQVGVLGSHKPRRTIAERL